MRMILGSSSKFRRAVMDELGFVYEVTSPNIDEKLIRHDEPEKLVLAIANAKADAVCAQTIEQAVVIAADQAVVWNNEIREKPSWRDEAKYFIQTCGEHPVIWYMPIPAGGFRFEDPHMQKFMIHTDGTVAHAMGLPKQQLLDLLEQVKYCANQ